MPEFSQVVEWGYQTGRFPAERREFWQNKLGAERRKIDREHRRIVASGGTVRTFASEVEAEIRGLSPILPPPSDSPWSRDEHGHMVLASGAAAPTLSRLEEIEAAVYGPSVSARHAAEDARAEAELAELEERDRLQASQGGLTPEEYRALFPGDAG